MQFHNPEILYGLFLLLIPILIHLFRLRKFRKEKFTNVAFLQKLSTQTRKSSEIKKWLILFTRMFLLSCIILAFAKPYFPSEKPKTEEIETLIYLDNSYSMQAVGRRGRLLDRNIQDLMEKLPEDRKFGLITNDEEYASLSREDLQQITYSPEYLNFETLLLKAKSRFNSSHSKHGKLLLISDFPETFSIPTEPETGNFEIYALPLRSEKKENVSLDSVFVEEQQTGGSVRLKVMLSASENYSGSNSVALYDGEQLLGKSNVSFKDGEPQNLLFQLNSDEVKNGLIQIQDNALQFDNQLFFSLKKTAPIKVVGINAADDGFLERIFTKPEFEYYSLPVDSIDYNKVTASQVIVLNEPNSLSAGLMSSLSKQKEDGAVFIIIPPNKEIDRRYSLFLQQFGIMGFPEIQEQEKLITTIKYQHPLFQDVFEKEIENFEYPRVQSFHTFNTTGSSILTYEDQRPFLTSSNGDYIFSSALNSDNTNFTRSPLVVPVFYNMARSVLKPPQLFYILGNPNRIDIPVNMQQDEILKITGDDGTYIPRQQVYANKVAIFTDGLLKNPGNYSLIKEGRVLQTLSFNVDREENKADYVNLETGKNIKIVENVESYLSTAGYFTESASLWKWFITFAIFFLILETLLLKFFK